MPMVRISEEIFDKLTEIAETTHRSKIGVIAYLLEKEVEQK